MDILPGGISEEFHIFRELQDIHDTGYFSSHSSIEDQWQQVISHPKRIFFQNSNKILSNKRKKLKNIPHNLHMCMHGCINYIHCAWCLDLSFRSK